MMLTRVLIHVNHNVANMVVLQTVNGGAALLLTVNDVRLTQDAQVVRCERLRNAQAGVQLAHTVRAVHQVMRKRQAQRVRERRENRHGRAELFLPVFGAATFKEGRVGGHLVVVRRGMLGDVRRYMVCGVVVGGVSFGLVCVLALSHSIFTLCTGKGARQGSYACAACFLERAPLPYVRLCSLVSLVRLQLSARCHCGGNIVDHRPPRAVHHIAVIMPSAAS